MLLNFTLFEETGPRDTQGHEGFVVVLGGKEPHSSFKLDSNLGHGVIVDSARHNLTLGLLDINLLGTGNETVVVVIAAEQEESVLGVAGGQQVDTRFNAGISGMFAYSAVWVWRRRAVRLAFVLCRYKCRIAKRAIVGIASHGEPFVAISKIESGYSHSSLYAIPL